MVDFSEIAPEFEPFRAAIKKLSPPWLSGKWGYRLNYTGGLMVDAIAEWLRVGIIQRMPVSCGSEAIPHIGRDRRIVRGRAETEAQYRERLRLALPTWKLAGNAPTLLKQLYAYLTPTAYRIRYVANGADAAGNHFADWWTIEGDEELTYTRVISPNNWNWDNTWDQVRFWLIIYGPVFTPWRWGEIADGGSGLEWGQGQSWGFLEDGSVLQDILTVVNQWKCAGSHAWGDGGLIVTTDDTFLDLANPPGSNMPDGTWGNLITGHRPDGNNGRDDHGLFLSGI
jgi:hypothetical protein